MQQMTGSGVGVNERKGKNRMIIAGKEFYVKY